MKISDPILNCSSIDARGDRFVVARPGQAFLTSWGEINRPDGEPWGLMFVKLDPTMDSFCGLSHESPTPLLHVWGTGGWHSRPTEVGRVVYSPDGTIHDTLPTGYQFWQESGSPVPRLETYPVKNGLNEWTIIGDLQVGQINAIEGIGVFDGSKLRLIRAGYAILVNVYRSGESVTISFVDNQSRGYIIQTTMGELKLLPEVSTPPAPTPPSVPPPIIEVPSVSVPNQFSVVEQIRAKYPTPLGPRHPEFLVEVASATGGKLLRKDSGTHVTLATGENVSQDIVVYGSTGVDILTDGEGLATAVWQVKDEVFDASRLVSVPSGGDIHPAPIPGLPGPEVDMSKVSQAISEALAPLDERLNVIGLKVSEVVAQLEALLKAPAKAPQKISVDTSRVWGHSHKVEFVV